MNSFFDRIGQALIVIGMLTLSYTAGLRLYGGAYQAYQQKAFLESLKASKSGSLSSTAAEPGSPKTQAVIGRLDIPSVNLSVMVLEGVGDSELRLGAGHVPGTALPGEPGNVGIAGHRDTFFRPLRKIQENDVITLTTLQGAFRYRVEKTWITLPDDIAVLESNSETVLTLITCHPFSYIGAAPDRFIVRARKITDSHS